MTDATRRLPLVLHAAIAAALPALFASPFVSAQALTLDRIMADPDWIGGGVEQAWWSWDGSQALYRRKREGATIRDVWQVPVAGGAPARVG
ncbi:MAG: S9 family peptidase, partial [Lysobacteraceae bacterium]